LSVIVQSGSCDGFLTFDQSHSRKYRIPTQRDESSGERSERTSADPQADLSPCLHSISFSLACVHFLASFEFDFRKMTRTLALTHLLLSSLGLRRITLPSVSTPLNLLSSRYPTRLNRRTLSKSRFDRSCSLFSERSRCRTCSEIRLWNEDYGYCFERNEGIAKEEGLYCYGWETEDERR